MAARRPITFEVRYLTVGLLDFSLCNLNYTTAYRKVKHFVTKITYYNRGDAALDATFWGRRELG